MFIIGYLISYRNAFVERRVVNVRLDHLSDIKRLVIYFFYDGDGVVDDYVPYMLNDVRKNCSELFVVCNGKLNTQGRRKLSDIADRLMVRNNEGFDVCAYKESMEYYGWNKLETFDEIVLMNFTIFGPVYPFSEMFEEMDQRDLDFWGITKYHSLPFDPFGTISYGYIPDHIQSHFIAVRSNMIKSIEFHNYWNNMGPITCYADAVGKHEAIFTKCFQDYGFVSDVYVQTDDLVTYTSYPLMHCPLELVSHRKCPIFKRKMFIYDYADNMNTSTGEAATDLYYYIKENLDYDLGMVWENLLRTDNFADIHKHMHLNYVLPKDHPASPASKCDLTSALVIHMSYAKSADKLSTYAASMPSDSDIFLAVTEKNSFATAIFEQRLLPRKLTVMRIPEESDPATTLFNVAALHIPKYDVVCFIHDQEDMQMEELSWSSKCYENLLGSKNYVRNVIARFSNEPRLGLLMPIPPNHATFFRTISNGWETESNYIKTQQLAKELDLNVKIDYRKDPIAPIGKMFWFKPDAIKPIYQKSWTDGDLVSNNYKEKTVGIPTDFILGFCAQHQGYYSVWASNDQYISLELTNYQYMLQKFCVATDTVLGPQSHVYSATSSLQALPSATVGTLLRRQIKSKLKRIVPNSIWKRMATLYRCLGGKKWTV